MLKSAVQQLELHFTEFTHTLFQLLPLHQSHHHMLANKEEVIELSRSRASLAQHKILTINIFD